MMRLGVEPDHHFLASDQARGMLSHYESRAGWIAEASRAMQRGNAGDEASRAIEIANRRFRRMSLPDIAMECLRMAGQQIPDTREEMVRRAYTTSPFLNIFTTNFNVKLLMGYMEHEDTTDGWVNVEDLPDHSSHDLIQSDPLSSLKKKTKNVPGQPVTGGDRKESYAIERFVGSMSIDEVDIIADRLRAFQRLPKQMGESARRVRPDLVYALMLNNPALANDSVNWFATAHNNLLGSSPLDVDNLSAAYAAMKLQTRNGATLAMNATHLIVPATDEDYARSITGSSDLRDTTADKKNPTMNPHRGRFTVRGEARIDNGVPDPDDPQTTIAGQPNSWWLVDSVHSPIYVGYLEGSGRAPRLRSRIIDRVGEYGMEWDVCIDLGVGISDYLGIVKRQSASL